MVLKKFEINENLSLTLEEEKTMIHVGGEPFQQCKYLLLNIALEDIISVNELKSIDEASEKLDHGLEPSDEYSRVDAIPPEVEFWGHCSNLQVWYENNYNTKLLHSNLAFPLLRKLTEAGDPLARKVFKEEIAKRYNTGVESVRTFLEKRKYLTYLTSEEFFSLIDSNAEYEVIKDLERTLNIERWNLDIKNGKVIKLSITGQDLNELPLCIRELKSLEYLDLRMNPIKELPEWIGEFQSLKVLWINNDQLTDLPTSIGNLQSLETLEAYNNGLKDIPESIGDLRSLKKLNLFNNRLTIIPKSIQNLTNLEELDLHINHLKFLSESIGNLMNLKVMDIGKNELICTPKTIGNLRSLKTLCLNENNLNELPDSFGNLSKLEILDISKNFFSSLRKPFETLISLKELYLDGNPFKGIPGFVYKLPNLRLINIKNTNIKKSGIMKKSLKKDVKIYF